MVEFPPSFLPPCPARLHVTRVSIPLSLSTCPLVCLSLSRIGSRWTTADRNLSNVFVRSRVQISIAYRAIRPTLQTFPSFNDMDTDRLFLKGGSHAEWNLFRNLQLKKPFDNVFFRTHQNRPLSH